MCVGTDYVGSNYYHKYILYYVGPFQLKLFYYIHWIRRIRRNRTDRKFKN